MVQSLKTSSLMVAGGLVTLGLERNAVRFPLYTANRMITTAHMHTYTTRPGELDGGWRDAGCGRNEKGNSRKDSGGGVSKRNDCIKG